MIYTDFEKAFHLEATKLDRAKIKYHCLTVEVMAYVKDTIAVRFATTQNGESQSPI
jgi:hypothetical protein